MALEVKPRPTPEYYIRQPKSEILARLPGANHIILGPSKSGKSVLWQSMLLDGYRGCFSRIFLFTPSGNVDDSLEPIKKYIEELGHDVRSEGPYIFEELDPAVIKGILKKQEKIHDTLKHKVYKDKNFKGRKWLPQILIVISDHADNPRAVHRAGGILETLFVRARHFGCSTWTDSQALKLLSPSVRLNIAGLAIFRLRSNHDLDSIMEFTALGITKEELLAMYREATQDMYSFLYVNMLERDISRMFFRKFSARLMPKRLAAGSAGGIAAPENASGAGALQRDGVGAQTARRMGGDVAGQRS